MLKTLTYNLSTKIGVKMLLTTPANQHRAKVVVGRCPCYFEDKTPVDQDWGKVVGGQCRCYWEDTKPVKHDWGKVK